LFHVVRFVHGGDGCSSRRVINSPDLFNLGAHTEAMPPPNFETIIQHELRFFPSEEMRRAFCAAMTPPREVVQRWIYGKEPHHCWIIASNSEHQIVYCETGFGPEFPWSCQMLGEACLGMDGQWCAYLYEAFVTSRLWKGQVPTDFILMGPGERQNTTTD
jgi:hypothetical protein